MSAIQRIARIDPTLHARLERLRPLLYTRIRGSADECGSEGTSAGARARPHVHAASAIRRWDDSTLAIVQDDVRALALLRADGTLAPLALEGESGSPLAAGASESKLTKLDLEAAVVLPDGRLLAFGSGALSAREYIVCVSRPYAVRVIGAHELYRTLRDDTAFSGAGLNLEGALIAQSRLILFQRGNAAPGSSRSFNAIGEMDLDAFVRWLDGHGSPPALQSRVRCELGAERGTPYGFTDATPLSGSRIGFLACAEAAADAIQDGPVLGCLFGVIDGDDIRVTRIVDEAGRALGVKLEGIEAGDDSGREFDVVADPDDPGRPALLGKLVVAGL